MANKKKETKSKKESTQTTKTVSKSPGIIWLYGAHPSVVQRTLRKIANYGSEDSIRLRKSLKLGLKDTVIPIYAYPIEGRNKIVEQLSDTSLDATFLVMGLSVDKKNKDTQKLYKGTQAAWVHPRETDFHIAMMRESISMRFKEAEEAKEEFEKYFSKHFDKKDIYII